MGQDCTSYDVVRSFLRSAQSNGIEHRVLRRDALLSLRTRRNALGLLPKVARTKQRRAQTAVQLRLSICGKFRPRAYAHAKTRSEPNSSQPRSPLIAGWSSSTGKLNAKQPLPRLHERMPESWATLKIKIFNSVYFVCAVAIACANLVRFNGFQLCVALALPQELTTLLLPLLPACDYARVYGGIGNGVG